MAVDKTKSTADRRLAAGTQEYEVSYFRKEARHYCRGRTPHHQAAR